MKRAYRDFWVGVWGACVTVVALTGSARGEEDIRGFLDGLRSRGFYDAGLDYLEYLRTSPLATEEFKQTIPYEQGVLLIESGRSARDQKMRQVLFDQARGKLEAFAKSKTGTLLGTKANGQLANLLVERGKALVKTASSGAQAVKKVELMADARASFEEAKKMLELCEAFYSQELADRTKFPAAIDEQTNPKLFELRQAFRSEQVQSRLLIAGTLFESASTLAPGSKQHTALLTEAGKQYGELFQKYRNWLAGLYACLYQGRCYQGLKQYDAALGCYAELIHQPNSDRAFRTLISKAYLHTAECLIQQKKYEMAAAQGKLWLDEARGAETRDPDWLAVAYQVALAETLRARALPKTQQSEASRTLADARDLAQNAARHPNEFQTQARELLAELRTGADAQEPKTFDEALERANEAIEQISVAQNMLAIIDVNNPEEVETQKRMMQEQGDLAAKYARLALNLAEPSTEPEKINQARFFLCAVDYQSSRWYDAAVMGEFLARRYPDSSGARTGAMIALSSYLNLYNEPGNTEKEFDAKRAVDIAQYIAKVWKGQSEGDKANDTLFSFMLQRKDYDGAKNYLKELSEDYAGRGAVELKLGQALWSEYGRAMRLPEDGRPPQRELTALQADALRLLESGLRRGEASGEVSPAVAGAGLSLAQIYLDGSQYDKAIVLLEAPQTGPLTLLAAGHPETRRKGYAELAYTLALRSYISSRPPQLQKAERVITDLESLMTEEGDAEKLTSISLNLGWQLQRHLQTLVAEGKASEAEAVTKGFELFLEHVAGRKQGNNWTSRAWVASTYYDLGSGFDQQAELPPRAKSYYTKAAAAYQQLLTEIDQKTITAPSPSAILAVHMRLAECHQKLGDYRSALRALAQVLTAKPTMLEAQKSAAYAYQKWGGAGEAKYYIAAIQGAMPDKTQKNLIWGWGKLAQITSRYPEHREVFYEARYNLARARFDYARRQTKTADQKKYLKFAKNDIAYLVKLYPDAGGAAWRTKYDTLLKEVQSALGERAVGLKELEIRPTATSK